MTLTHGNLWRKSSGMRGRLNALPITLLFALLITSCSIKNIETTKSLPYSIVDESYTDKDISIRYPQVTGIDDSKKEEIINDLLKSEAFVPLTDDLSNIEGYDLSMDIDYVVSWKSENLLSVQYKGSSYSEGET